MTVKIEMHAGSADDLGATPSDSGVNFAVFSAGAERIDLCLYDERNVEIARLPLKEYTDEVWHGFVPKLKAGQLYAFRAHGPNCPEKGLRFNESKLLLDPYAREIVGELKWDEALYAYNLRGGEDRDLEIDTRDSAPFMPRCRVVGAPSLSPRIAAPRVAWADTIFYEMHVRGHTILNPAIPKEKRGTFDALGDDAMIDYIRSLGVTSVELLPIHAFVDDHRLHERGLRNYWGYNSIGFFAPEQRYLGAGGLASFRDMVRKLHDAGLEVILDVVYNHTAEGNEFGPTLSFKGLDNQSYYRLLPDDPRRYINDTGTGNTFNTSHPRALQLVLDSLRYWAGAMEVDGFRFDLGTILGREPHGFDQRSGFFDAIAQDPLLRRIKLVGEPWDIGPGGYQVGGFPPGWSEWNDKYRDTVRSYWRDDHGTTRDLAARVTGSGDIYDKRGRRPWSSVNFVTAHDGFTLHDLVAYEHKHNEANGEDNADGHSNNLSCNYGVEGETDDPAINETRARQKRNMLATLLLSHGAPMLLAGDEFGRTQAGNNNVYCQDNEIAWTRWDDRVERDLALTDFVRKLVALRRDNAIFRRADFRDGAELHWLNPTGGEQTEQQWNDPGATTIGLLLRRRAPGPGIGEALLLFNPFHDVVEFKLPRRKRPWRVLLDTSVSDEATRQIEARAIGLPARSLLVLT